MRTSGILMAISSLPSKYGIGCFSKEAYEFVDFLAKAEQRRWQILPLGPTGYGDSPYQSFSTYAGNPYFIDPETLVEEGLLTKKDCEQFDFGDDPECVDYEKIYLSRFRLLHIAYRNWKPDASFDAFVEENKDWLYDYALYMSVKNLFNGKSWIEWDEDIRLRKPDAVKRYQTKCKDEIAFYMFQQYQFMKQWKRLKAYANKKKISIIGDIPIYVAFDSADTWANPELFMLDRKMVPLAVAGVPPDAFSATGQLWGNPLYNWDYHKKTAYAWWIHRIAHCTTIYDIVRIDHFRGFDEYYSIPYGDNTAMNGHWEKGPGYDIFAEVKKRLPGAKIIAEDLGYLTDTVIALLKKSGYPGMKVLQFAFDSREESDHLPHHYGKNCVVYTGTHDNDTTVHWYGAIPKKDRLYAKAYLGIRSKKDAQWTFIRGALASVADTAIVPMQDYLGLDAWARMNTPSTLGGNWLWRMKKEDASDELASKIAYFTDLYGRKGENSRQVK